MFTYPDQIVPLEYYRQSPQREIISRIRAAKQSGKRIVIASGVFDLLHEAHCAYLAAAKQAGDILVVLVESDERVKQMKGEDRPKWPAEKRLAEIKKLAVADEVLLLPKEFNSAERYEEILILLAPDIYAVSSHSSHLAEKAALMERYLGELKVVLEEIPDISTTKLLQLENR